MAPNVSSIKKEKKAKKKGLAEMTDSSGTEYQV